MGEPAGSIKPEYASLSPVRVVRASRDSPGRCSGPSPESRGQHLALTVLREPFSADDRRAFAVEAGWGTPHAACRGGPRRKPARSTHLGGAHTPLKWLQLQPQKRFSAQQANVKINDRGVVSVVKPLRVSRDAGACGCTRGMRRDQSDCSGQEKVSVV